MPLFGFGIVDTLWGTSPVLWLYMAFLKLKFGAVSHYCVYPLKSTGPWSFDFSIPLLFFPSPFLYTRPWSIGNNRPESYTLAVKSHPIVGLLEECQSCLCEAIIAYMLTVCNMTIEIIWQTGPDEHTVPFTPREACHLVWPVEFWHQMSPAGTAADICSPSLCACVFACVFLGSFNKPQCLLLPYCLCLFISNPKFAFSVPQHCSLCWCILSIHSAILPMIL